MQNFQDHNYFAWIHCSSIRLVILLIVSFSNRVDLFAQNAKGDSVRYDLLIDAIKTQDTQLIMQILSTNPNMIKAKHNNLYNNLLEYAIFWHRNNSVTAIISFMEKNGYKKMLKDKNTIKISVRAGNANALSLLLQYEKKYFKSEEFYKDLKEFIINHNAFKDTTSNDSEYIRYIPSLADADILNLLLSKKKLNLDKRYLKGGESIRSLCNRYAHLKKIIEEIIDE